jgi:hypothetical protein
VHILKSGYNKRYLPLVNGKSLLFGHAHWGFNVDNRAIILNFLT